MRLDKVFFRLQQAADICQLVVTTLSRYPFGIHRIFQISLPDSPNVACEYGHSRFFVISLQHPAYFHRRRSYHHDDHIFACHHLRIHVLRSDLFHRIYDSRAVLSYKRALSIHPALEVYSTVHCSFRQGLTIIRWSHTRHQIRNRTEECFAKLILRSKL